jgi:integrase
MRQARAFEAEQRTTIARGGWVDPTESARPFKEVATAWLRSNPGKRPATLARDEVELRLHIIPALGSRPIGGISPSDVETLVVVWSKSAEPRTVARRYGVLRAVMNYAVSRDLIGRSPCRGIRLPEAQPLDRELPTADEVAALAGAMGRYGGMAYLGVVLGLRWGEVAGLRVRRLDLEVGRVTIAEQVTRGPKGISVVGPPKSRAGRRTMAMPPLLTDLLAEHLRVERVTEPDAFVFAAPDGGHLVYSNWRQRVWLPACKEIGRPEFGFHDLRRANATGLVAEGVDIKTAQERLGHSDPRLTLAIYAQATTEADRQAADRMGDRFMLSKPHNPAPSARHRGRRRSGPDQLGLGL